MAEDPADHPTNAEPYGKRASAWLNGPTAEERTAWAARRVTFHPNGEETWPSPAEVETWAAREHARRARWRDGPDDAERDAYRIREVVRGVDHPDVDDWTRRETQHRAEWLRGLDGDRDRSRGRHRRDEFEAFQDFVDHAAMIIRGAVQTAAYPIFNPSVFLRETCASGRRWRDAAYYAPRPPRVPFYDE